MKITFIICIYLALLFPANAQNTWVNISDKGADNEGKIKCTGIINQTIDSLARLGGGTIYFPSGTFFTGPIIFRSNITLYIDAGAILKFSDDFDDYLPMVQSRWEDVRVKNFKSQFYAFRCNNIAIKGDGHIEGNGKKWWDFGNKVKTGEEKDSKWQAIFMQENSALLEKNDYLKAKNAFLRPQMVMTYECSNVLIEGVSFSNPPFWTIVPTFCDNVTIEGITIENPDFSPNTDGIDLSSCTNVRISNSHISVGDDCIVIKSGRDEDGREAARPTENLTITNCTMLKGHGGVVIGSEMSGDVRRVAISNCVFQGTDVGIRIKTMRGRGGIVEDVRVSNIVMYDMVKEGVIITMRYQPTKPEPVSERTPSVRNIHLTGINIRNAQRAIAVLGLEEREVTDITFSDMVITANKGILLENSSNIKFHDISLEIKEGNPFVAIQSRDIGYDMIKVVNPKPDLPLISLTDCQLVRITNNFQSEAISQFLQQNENCSGLYYLNNIMPETTVLYNKNSAKVFLQSNIYKKQ